VFSLNANHIVRYYHQQFELFVLFMCLPQTHGTNHRDNRITQEHKNGKRVMMRFSRNSYDILNNIGNNASIFPTFVFFTLICHNIGVARGDPGGYAPQILAYLVILCFEKGRLKQKYCCSPKIKHFGPSKFPLQNKFVAGYPLCHKQNLVIIVTVHRKRENVNIWLPSHLWTFWKNTSIASHRKR